LQKSADFSTPIQVKDII